MKIVSVILRHTKQSIHPTHNFLTLFLIEFVSLHASICQLTFSLYFFPVYLVNKFIPNKVVQLVKVWRVRRPIVFVDYSWKIACTPFLGKVMGVSHCNVLMKHLIVTENLVAVFLSYWQNFFNINFVVDHSFFQDDQWHYSF